jgi:hypothetical protein
MPDAAPLGAAHGGTETASTEGADNMRTATLAAGLTLLAIVQAASAADTDIAVDKEKKTISIPCKIAPRKIDDPSYKGEIYPIEVIACWPFDPDPAKRGQKAHETVVVFDRNLKPSAVQKAVEGLGLKPGKPAYGEVLKAEGPEVKVYLELPGPDGTSQRVAIEKTLVDKKTNKPMPMLKWYFTGSDRKKPNPEKDEMVFGADLTGTLIALFPVTNDTVFQTNLTMKEEPILKLETNKNLLPKEGTPVKLIIEVK